ncbi:MFS transporter [Terrihabitans soli]|uniref:MFS transporter n=1 Tax=Terrihabitans soli TaxID=708113 RepID=A0A6S6QN46_9HYPH|nr:RsmB/NOP family class I SAM-dependent RNA methyltransferase [Terrihabitans soli]BCJ90816.1 MFS transporter [Terrihabitans soli]
MKPAAHASAAIEILTDLEAKKRPVADALKDWGLTHRFAGSKDRAQIASLIYDVLRKRSSLGFRMGAETPRALVLGALAFTRGISADDLAAQFADSPHAPDALSDAERKALNSSTLEGAPAFVRGDYPQWLDAHLQRIFGEDRADEGAALSERAPLDLRVNLLKGTREEALAELSHLHPEPTPHSPLGIRIPLLADGRGPPVQSEPAFLKGLVEVQDEGSQIASLIAQAKPGEQVIDLCAGGGGKTLALSAGMENKGQIFAHDRDLRRLAPLHERAERAGVRNLQIRSPRGKEDVLKDLEGKADLVLVDAPCTGAGTWRRNPDAKWRMRPGSLEIRQKEQDAVLGDAARLVKPGGRLVYITCSLLAEENEDRLQAFRAAHPGFRPVPIREALSAAGLGALDPYANADGSGLLLTPRRSGTDGFFVAVLRQ